MNIAILVAFTSLHVPMGHHQNQLNEGVALQFDNVTVGAYQNSNNRRSYFGTYSWGEGWLHPFVGVVSGYRLPVGPAAGLAIVPWKENGPVLTLTPMDGRGGFVIGLGWRYQL
jgi:hypothetical protein